MNNTENNRGLYLLIDIDDLLVFSSDKLQTIVNEKTNFKTQTLHMLEQLKRNCRYLVSEVKKECGFAKEYGIKPNLGRFHVFNNNLYRNDELYTRPILEAEKYYNVANRLYNQFLEERDTFLETDNLPRGEKKNINLENELDLLIEFSKLINDNREAFHKINLFCLKQANYLVNEARKNNHDGVLTIPEYGELVSMDSNDIIKTGSIDDQDNREYVLYVKPLEIISKCLDSENRIQDILTNFKVFHMPSQEIVDYNEIHSVKNVNWKAVSLVEDLIHSGIFSGVYFSTHHNGDREEKAKIRLMNQIVPEADGFIGQRFHAEEHTGKRRDRSSKIDVAVKKLGITPEQIVLFDDSTANCRDCREKHGTEILYKPETDSEKIKGRLAETGFNRIIDLSNNNVYSFIAVADVKVKRK